MNDRLHGILEDLGAEIGFSATTALVAWYGGTCVYVPAKITPEHPVCRVIGQRAFALLVAEYGGSHIDLPAGRQDELDRRDRDIAKMLEQDVSVENIAAFYGTSARLIHLVRERLEKGGIVEISVAKRPGRKPGAKAGDKSPVGNAG